jgi:hypothetical protein
MSGLHYTRTTSKFLTVVLALLLTACATPYVLQEGVPSATITIANTYFNTQLSETDENLSGNRIIHVENIERESDNQGKDSLNILTKQLSNRGIIAAVTSYYSMPFQHSCTGYFSFIPEPDAQYGLHVFLAPFDDCQIILKNYATGTQPDSFRIEHHRR